MNFEIITIHSSRNVERSIIVYDDGTLMLRTTTNALGILSGYRQTIDKPTTIEDIARLSPAVAAEAAAVLARLMAALQWLRAREEAVGRVVSVDTTRPDEAIEGSV